MTTTPESDPRSDPAAVAAVDCGTNSTRLLILDASGEAVDRRMRITRLGEGVDASGILAPQAIDRTVTVLAEYRRAMDDHGVARVRAAATSAVRDAANGEDFLAAATEALGARPELLSGTDEGRLSFAGATRGLPGRPGDRELVVDIGGGSTELVVGVVGGTPEDVVARSLDIGCVRVTERFFLHDPPTTAEIEAAKSEVDRLLVAARDELPSIDAPHRLVGLAGTVSTIGSLALGLAGYDRDQVHHSVLSRADVEMWLVRLAGENAAARLARPGMVEGREDVIVAGVLILAQVMAAFGRSECLVSESDILDGLAASLR